MTKPKSLSTLSLLDICSILFYCLTFVALFWNLGNQSLFHFEGRMISEATLEGFDIKKRIHFFYGALICILLIILLFVQFKKRTSSFFLSLSPHSKAFHYASLLGLIFLGLHFWGLNLITEIKILIVLQLFYLFTLLLFTLFGINRKIVNLNLTHIYIFILTISISLYFICYSFYLFYAGENLSFETMIVLLFVLLIVFLIHFRFKKDIIDGHWLNYKMRLWEAFTFAPLLPVLTIELYFIANRYGWNGITFNSICIILFGLLLTSIFIKYIRKKSFAKQNHFPSRYFGLLLFSLACFAAYYPIIHLNGEMFEQGNELLPVMELHEFGVVPTIEKFNSHMLSEVCFPLLYSFINQTWDYDVLIYNFLQQAIPILISYHFFRKYLTNVYLAFILILTMPLLSIWLSFYHAIALLSVFVLNWFLNADKTISLKKYLGLAIFIIFILLWRMDLGYPSIIAISGIVLLFLFHHFKQFFNLRYILMTTISTFLLIGISIWMLSLIRNVSILDKLQSTLHYLSSAQTYGHISLGDSNTVQYGFHYFIFPVTALLLLIYLISQFKSYTEEKTHKETYVALLFVIIYYLFNFQRGLVRHSLIEGDDMFTSAFIFLILTLSISLFTKNTTFYSIKAIAITSLCIMAFKFQKPEASQKSLIKSVADKLENGFGVAIEERDSRINRVIDHTKEINTKYGALINYFKTELKKDETFIDFSNTPLIYYFTGKISPSDFHQNPLPLHDDYLQDQFMKNLKNYKVPYVLFGKVNEDFFDAVDAVPNTLRHYKIAEYIYKHYHPYDIIDGYRIWKENNNDKIEINANTLFADSIESVSRIYNLKMLPYIWGQFDVDNSKNNNKSPLKQLSKVGDTSYVYEMSSNKSNAIELKIDCREKTTITLEYGDSTKAQKHGGFSFTGIPERTDNKYYIRTASQYNWHERVVNYIKVKSSQTILINELNTLIGD